MTASNWYKRFWTQEARLTIIAGINRFLSIGIRNWVLVIDLREIQEQRELETIPGSINVARGMLEFWASPGSPHYRGYLRKIFALSCFVLLAVGRLMQ